MGTSWKKFDPPRFFQFSPEPVIMFGIKENKEFLKGSIWDVLMVESLLRVDPTQSYGENTKKTYPRLHRFCYETPLKIEEKFSKFVFAGLVQNQKDIRESNNNI